MQASFSTIDEYIGNLDESFKKKFQKLRDLLKKNVPKDATETINYGMPTFRWHGNLIHFAQYKHHIGLYPGTAAIEALADKLTGYKTSKGAIQIPIDKELPQEIILAILNFNIDLLKDKVGPNWHVHRDNWKECEELMQQIISKTNLKKDFKWGADMYTYNGKHVISWGGFKTFFSLWFHNGVFLSDPEKVLISASQGKTKALRQWRFTDVKAMNEQKITNYINESIQTVKDGKEIKIEKSTPKTAQGLLKEYLDTNTEVKHAFEKLTPGKQKEYIEHIEEAKLEKTKIKRLEKIVPLIVEGKALHDKYKR